MSSRVAPWLLNDELSDSYYSSHPFHQRLRRRLSLLSGGADQTSADFQDGPESAESSRFPWIYARQIFSKSSLNGISHIASADNWFRRFLWTVLFILCLGGFIYQAGSYFYLYFKYPTTVEVKVENKGSLEFPGVTICNSNKVRRLQYCETYHQECLINATDFEEKVSRLDKQLQIALGHNKSGLFINCSLEGREIISGEDCFRHFNLFFIPDHGNCFTFNAVWNSKGEKMFHAYESDIWNSPTVLELDLNVEAEEYLDQYVSPAILVSVHAPDSYPDPEAGRVKALPGNLYNIGLKKSTTVLLPTPYQTNCTEYRDLPWTKGYPGKLHPKMCTQECSRNAQIEQCKCVSPNLTRLTSDEAPCTANSDAALCAEMAEDTTKSYCRTLCRVPCERTIYEVTVDTTAWPKPNEKGELGKWANKSLSEIRKNLLKVKIYLRSMEHTKYEHLPKYLLVEVFSHLGGYLSLWLGFSVLTMWEIVENSALIVIKACQTANTATQTDFEGNVELAEMRQINVKAARPRRRSANTGRAMASLPQPDILERYGQRDRYETR